MKPAELVLSRDLTLPTLDLVLSIAIPAVMRDPSDRPIRCFPFSNTSKRPIPPHDPHNGELVAELHAGDATTNP